MRSSPGDSAKQALWHPNLGGQIHTKTRALLSAYPIVASSCYSIGNNLDRDPLLDWVIVDEASQVLLPPGLAALSVARNAVVVGDTKQLSPIFAGWCESECDPPDPRVDAARCRCWSQSKRWNQIRAS